MNAIADLCLVPIGVGVDIAPHVATCQRASWSRPA